MKNTSILTFSALMLLTACDTTYVYQIITGTRPDQTVDGPRRIPMLNTHQAANPALTTTNQPPTTHALAPVNNPYDQYDANGKEITDTSASNEKSSYFSHMFDPEIPSSNTAATTVAPALNDAVRKPLPGNPYYSNETSPAAPVAPPALSVNDVPKKTGMLGYLGDRISGKTENNDNYTYPKLSSVPPKPKQFDEVKNAHEQGLNELEVAHAVAQQDKGYLDQEATGTSQPPQNLVVPPVAAIRPLITPAAPSIPVPVAPAIQTNKQPVINVVTPAAPPTAQTVPAIQVPVNDADNAIKTATDTGSVATLPSPEMIKVMRPSRYEQRVQHYQSTSDY